MAAGLERAVQRCAAGAFSGIAKRVHLGVRSAGKLMRSAPDHHAFAINNDRANHRVRTGSAAATLRNGQRARHVFGVSKHV